jgi:ABC-2 type transport system ATP-binding protein
MIQAKALTRRYGGFTAVNSISFDVPAGEVVGFLGPNGAGKTTTIRMMTGALRPTSGSVSVCGFDLVDQPMDARRRIGYLPESTPLYTEMRVADYLRFRARVSGVARRARSAAIDQAIERCRLGEVRRRPIGELSKGFRQRVGLAGAIVHEPPVIVLDEPTVGLDPAQIQEVRSLIRGLAKRHTVLLSTHILPEVEAVCDRVLLIARGRLRVEGRLDELRRSTTARSEYLVETTLRSAPDLLRTLPGVTAVAPHHLDDHWLRIAVAASVSEDLREPIAHALRAAGALVRELHRRVETLEEFFLRVVREAETSA